VNRFDFDGMITAREMLQAVETAEPHYIPGYKASDHVILHLMLQLSIENQVSWINISYLINYFDAGPM